MSSYSKYTPLAPLHPWLWPIQPWHRIHLDFAGPVRGKMLLVVFDAHSKWPEVFPMVSTTTLATGTIPRQFVSDNGPQFISDEFKQFLAWRETHQELPIPSSYQLSGSQELYLKRALKKGNHFTLDIPDVLSLSTWYYKHPSL